MTRFTPLWLQAGSYAASVDRRLIGALYPDARSSGCALSAVGAMDLQVAAGSVAVPLAGGVGSVLCVSDDYETVTLAAAPASGVNRYDLITCQAHGADIDAGADEFRFLAVKGADGGGVPATPPNAAALGYVLVVGGSAAVAPANITDLRPGNLAVPPTTGAPVSFYVGQGVQSIPAKVWTTLTTWVAPAENIGGGGWAAGKYTFPADGRYMITASILWGALPNNQSVSYQQQLGFSGSPGPGHNGQTFLAPYTGGNLSAPPSVVNRYFHKGDTVVVQLYNGYTAALSTFGGYGALSISKLSD